MKLQDYSFGKDGDYFVIKTILRIFKEKMFSNINGEQTNDILIRKGGAKRIIEECYSSRRCHKTEPKIINYCYWPCDSGFGFQDFLYVIYVANIIKEFKGNMTQKEHKFVSKMFFDKLTSYLITKGSNTVLNNKADEFVFSNLEVLDEAISILDKRYSDIMKSIIRSEKGLKNIPF
jgi:hypothetical protein